MSQHDSRSADEIEADIQRVRARMRDTINAIENKLSPGQLIDQTIHYLRHNNGASEFASNLGATVRDRPVPVTLMSIGLGWLMMAQRPGRETANAEHTGAKAGDIVSSAQDKAGDLAQRTRERMERVKSGTRASAGSLSHQARQAQGQLAHMMREQPLIMGALGIALGAALGAGLAPTRQEDELMGEARDKAAEVGQRQSEKVESTARAAKEEASQHAAGVGLTPTGADQTHRYEAQEPPKDDADTPGPAPTQPL